MMVSLRQFKLLAFLGCCSVAAARPVAAQDSGDQPQGDVDPIAVVAAHIAKGQTNNMQRRAIRREWLTLAAQEVEDFLRTEAFNNIIAFVQKNHELFRTVYAGLKTAKGVMATGKRVQSVIGLQRRLILQFTETAELLAGSRHFTAGELRSFTGTLDGVIRDTGANFDLLIKLFRQTTTASLSDMERFEVLRTVEQRLVKNLQAVTQLNRYIVYLDANRSVHSQEEGVLNHLLTSPN